MTLKSLHLLLTYQCTFECDHCFVWGSPWQQGTMTLATVRLILEQAREMGTIGSFYFEGGEPFLYYALLLQAAREIASQGYQAGIVTNSYWASSEEDALANLQPLSGLVQSLSVSSDLFHWSEAVSRQALNASAAAEKAGIAVGFLSIAQPARKDAPAALDQLPEGESKVMFRGRAADKLAHLVAGRPWEQYSACPNEKLRDPGRVHLDAFGYVHLCQGIALGNYLQKPLKEIWAQYEPETHPIVGPLLNGGPAELVRRYGLAHEETYADACHLCYAARLALRPAFPEILAPDPMYGIK